jgi:hypothetical protein
MTDPATTVTVCIVDIASSSTGADLGSYEASSEEAALDVYAQRAGYANFSDLARTLGQSIEEARSDLIVEVTTATSPH